MSEKPRSLFRNATFLKLFLAAFTSQLGTVIGNMAFFYYLVDRYSDRPALATFAELMYSLPTLLVFWIVGVIADRLDRRAIALYSDWIRAALTAFLLLSVHFDLLPLCFLLLFLRSAVSKFFGPAESGLLQGSISEGQFVQAAGLNQTMMGLFMLLGMSLGATAYHFLGIKGAILIDGISFIVSGVLLSFGTFTEQTRMPNGPYRLKYIRPTMIIKDFWSGLLYMRSNRLLFSLLSGFVLFGIVNGLMSVLPIFTMKYKLNPDRYMVYSSLITICIGVGAVIGSVVGPLLIKRFGRAKMIISGLLCTGVMALLLGLTDSTLAYLIIVFLAGFNIAPTNIAIGGWIPELVIPQQIGRVNALIEPLLMLGHSLSLGVVAVAFPSLLSITSLHYLLGGCTLIVSLVYALVLPPLVRSREQRVPSSAI